MKTAIQLKAELGRCMVLTAMLLAAVGCGGAEPDSSEAQFASEAEDLPPDAVAGLELARKVIEAPNPTEAYQALSETERQTLDRATQPVRVELVETRGRMPTQDNVEPDGCWRAYARYAAKGALGNTIYTWWQGLHWCGSGSRITFHRVFDRGGETRTPGWSHEGPGSRGALRVGAEVRTYTQEKFRFRAGPVDFTRTECAQVRGRSNGRYTIRQSCNLQ